MSSIPPQTQAKGAILLAVVLIASQIPMTLQEIEHPILRIILQLVAILTLVALGSLFWRVQNRPETLRPPGRYRMKSRDLDTPKETPYSKRKDKKQ